MEPVQPVSVGVPNVAFLHTKADGERSWVPNAEWFQTEGDNGCELSKPVEISGKLEDGIRVGSDIVINEAVGLDKDNVEPEVPVLLRAKQAPGLPQVATDLLQGDTVIVQRGLLDLLVRPGGRASGVSAHKGLEFLKLKGVTSIKLERYDVGGDKYVLGIYCEKAGQYEQDATQTVKALVAERLHINNGKNIAPDGIISVEWLHAVTALSDTVPGMQNVFVVAEVDAYSLEGEEEEKQEEEEEKQGETTTSRSVCLHEVKTRRKDAKSASFSPVDMKKYIISGVRKYVIYKREDGSDQDHHRLTDKQVVNFTSTALGPFVIQATSLGLTDDTTFHFEFAQAFVSTIQRAVADKVLALDESGTASYGLGRLYELIGSVMEDQLASHFQQQRKYGPRCTNRDCDRYHAPVECQHYSLEDPAGCRFGDKCRFTHALEAED
ncbi:MAG: hypothetical protein MHM6MM_007484 [Cercozoa sp. M6MM]